VFCAKICPSISKKYFKEVFAFSYLKIIEERKKDIAISFAQNIVEIRKKIEDIGSTSKIENTLNSLKNVFHKDNFIQAVCLTAFNSITTA
jgi:disulfide oxidoreductase YuzD